ncbi:hypothetical protein N9174_00455 [bacterium]|nr:hypothetical protein [bacterium]
MTEEVKTKEQLIAELSELQRRTLELDSLESDRKRTEDALRESEAKFQTLVEQIPNAVIYMAALEALATQIGGVLARVRTEEALQRAHNGLERRKPWLPGAARDCQGFSEG